MGYVDGDQMPWRRWWRPTPDEPHLFDGLLPDPLGSTTQWLNRDLVQLSATAETRGRVLLADPGMGKTSELNREVERLKRAGEHVALIDLGEFSDASEVVRAVDKAADRWGAEAAGAGRDLVIALDAFDEPLSLGLPTLGETLVRELAEIDSARLRIIVASRASLWRKPLEEAMRQWWGADQVKRLHLAPLTRADVRAAAATEVGDANAFLDGLQSRGVLALTGRPVTLRLLLAAARAGGLPDNRVEIYRQGTAALAQERHDSRRLERRLDGPPVDRLVQAARRLAAITLLTGRRVIVRRRAEAAEQAVALEDVHNADVTLDELEAVYDSALLTAGSSGRRWSHHTIAEYLAAAQLAELPLETTKSLLTLPEEPGRLVPQLQETASWVAGLQPEAFEWLLDTAPVQLISPDLAGQPETTRAQVADAVIAQLAAGKPLPDRQHLDGLAHTGLADKLRPLILAGEPEWRRRGAMYMLAGAAIHDCDEELTTIVEAVISRGTAAAGEDVRLADLAAAVLTHDHTSPPIDRLLTILASNDAPASTRATLLRGLWPQFITTDQLVAAVSPEHRFRHEGVGRGALYAFTEAVNSGTVAARDLLPWFAPVSEVRLHDERTREVATAAVLDAISTAEPGTEAWNAVIGLVRQLIRVSVDAERWRATLAEVGDHKRRALARAVLAGRHDPSAAFELRNVGGLPDDDLGWWLNEYATDKSSGGVDGGLSAPGAIDAIVSSGDRVTIQALANEARARHPEHADYIETQTSDTAFDYRDRMRSEMRERVDAREARQREHQFDHDRLARLLRTGLFAEVLVEADKHTPRSDSSTPGAGPVAAWHALNDEERRALATLALGYLLQGPPATGSETTEDSREEQYEAAGLAAQAHDIVFAHEAIQLRDVPDATWLQWLPALVDVPNGYHAARTAVQAATGENPATVVQVLMGRIEEDARRGFVNAQILVGDLRVVEIGEHAASLATPDVQPHAVSGLLAIALEHGAEDRAVEQARELLRRCPDEAPPDSPRNIDDPAVAAWTRATGAVIATMAANAGVTLFDEVMARFRKTPAMFRDVARTTHRVVRQAFGGLENGQISELYQWARREFPARQTRPGVVVDNDPVEEIIGDLLGVLRRRADLDAAATLADIASIEGSVWLAEEALGMRDKYLAETAVAVHPVDLAGILDARDRMLVTTRRQIVHVLLEALDELEVELRRDRALRAEVWNRQADDSWMPMEELEFSTWLKKQLQARAGNRIAILRETRINPRLGRESADDPDLLGLAISTQEVLEVPVEVKGNWHRDVVTDLTNQLVNRYLDGPAGDEGIYVVGYFHGDLWTDADGNRRAAASKRTLELLKTELEAAAEVAKPKIAHVRVLEIALDRGDVIPREDST